MAANLTASDELDFDFKLESRTAAAATITRNYGLMITGLQNDYIHKMRNAIYSHCSNIHVKINGGTPTLNSSTTISTNCQRAWQIWNLLTTFVMRPFGNQRCAIEKLQIFTKQLLE